MMGKNGGQAGGGFLGLLFDRTLIVLIVMIYADLIINQFKSNNPLHKKRQTRLLSLSLPFLRPLSPLMRAILMR